MLNPEIHSTKVLTSGKLKWLSRSGVYRLSSTIGGNREIDQIHDVTSVKYYKEIEIFSH